MKKIFFSIMFMISAFSFAQENAEETIKESFVNKISSIFSGKEKSPDGEPEEIIHIDIIDACKKSDIELIKQAIKIKEDFNVTDENGDNPFFIACEKGNVALADLLLSSKNADVNSRDVNKQTVFMRACVTGNKNIIDFLTEKEFHKKYKQKCNVLLRDNKNHDAFMLLCMNGKVDLRDGNNQLVADRLLLTNYSIINEKDAEGDTALIHAAKAGNEKVVKYLFSREADVNIVDKTGDSLLLLLCRNGLYAMAETLLNEYKVDINAKNKGGNTALMVLANEGKDESVNFLIENGADGSITDNSGRNLFMYACVGHSFKLANKLLSDGIDINAQDKQGNTSLHLACAKNDKIAIEYLCEKKNLDVEINNIEKNSPIALYCKTNGIDFSENYDERIQSIIASDDVTLLRMFLHDEKNILYSSDKIPSILIFAAEKGSISDVKYLIENKLYATDVKTALKASRKNKNDEITALLRVVRIVQFRELLRRNLIIVISVFCVVILILMILWKVTKNGRNKKRIRKDIQQGQNLEEIEKAKNEIRTIQDKFYQGNIADADLMFNKNQIDKWLEIIEKNKDLVDEKALCEMIENFELLMDRNEFSTDFKNIIEVEISKLLKIKDEKKPIVEKIKDEAKRITSQKETAQLEDKTNENIEE